MRRAVMLGLLVLLPILQVRAQKPPGGSIAGRALTSDGRGIRAMIVLEPASGASAAALPPAAQRALTDANGAFQFPLVSAGKYTLCAQPIGGQGKNANEFFADSCQWRIYTAPLQVIAGQAITGVTLAVPQGALLRVRANDPAGVLAAAPAGPGPPGLDARMQVFLSSGDGLLHPLPITSQSASGREHDVVVPIGLALSLSVRNPGLGVTDGAGKAVAAAIPVLAAAGAALPPVQLTVTGRLP